MCLVFMYIINIYHSAHTLGILSNISITIMNYFTDDFHTPMSTPPSEIVDEQTGEQTMDITDLSQLDLTESQFYNKLYER